MQILPNYACFIGTIQRLLAAFRVAEWHKMIIAVKKTRILTRVCVAVGLFASLYQILFMRTIFWAFIICCANVFNAVGQETNVVKATAVLKQATIFQNQAELSHAVTVQIPEGQTELSIDNVSGFINSATIQIKGGKGLTVLNTSAQAPTQATTETAKVRMWRDSVANLQNKIDDLNTQMEVNAEVRQVLSANKELKATTGLSVAELTKLLDFYKQKLNTLFQERQELQNRLNTLNTAKEKAQQNLQAEIAKNTTVAGKISVVLQANYAAKQELTVVYVTNNASWTPTYELRATDFTKPLQVVFKASIYQNTGLNWRGVALKLNSGVPGDYSVLPSLKPWFLRFLEDEVVVMGYSADAVETQIQGKAAGVAGASSSVRIRGSSSIKSGNAPLYIVDGVPMEASEALAISPNRIKKVDVLKDASASALYGSRAQNGVVLITTKTDLSDDIAVNDKATEIEYSIETPTDLPSDTKPKYLTLNTQQTPADFTYAIWAGRANHAFAVATVQNWEKLQLLPGAASIFWNDDLVGKTYLGTANTNDSLQLNLGVDKRIAVKKEKQADFSKTRFIGSNVQQSVQYAITVRNNKTKEVAITVYDQIPLSTGTSIDVFDVDVNGGNLNPETGMVQWQYKLATGESKLIKLGYTVKYPKDKTIALP